MIECVDTVANVSTQILTKRNSFYIPLYTVYHCFNVAVASSETRRSVD